MPDILTTSMDKILKLIQKEKGRQQSTLQMIPSENYVSKHVLEALGSVVVNKYSEGQTYKRYYQGNEYIDKIEAETKSRALELFDLKADDWGVNVQAANGSSANLAVYNAMLELGDPILSMSLHVGGHLSHGWKLEDGKPVSITAKLYDSSFYGVEKSTGYIDYNALEDIAKKVRPSLIISGGTAYPRDIDYKNIADIAKSVGALYLADVSHEAGLIAGSVLNSPFDHADIITMTTRKTLRGPVGAIIFSKKKFETQINKSVFPGLQGGPLNNNIAAIGIALKEAASPNFKKYANQVIKNAKKLESEFINYGLKLVTDGTDKHLIVIDLTNKNTDGAKAALALEEAGIIVNKNTIPNESGSPFYPSGIRLGTPAITTRGMNEKEMVIIAKYINQAINISENINHQTNDDREMFKKMVTQNKELKTISKEVNSLCQKFPIYVD